MRRMRAEDTTADDVTIVQIVWNQSSALLIWTLMMSDGLSYTRNGPHIGEGSILEH